MTLYFLIAEIVFGFVSISVFPVLRAMMSKLVESKKNRHTFLYLEYIVQKYFC
jgi:hypothetical protein